MLFQAGFVTFIRTLIIIGIIFYGIRLLLRFVLPWVLKYLLNKQFNSSNNYQNQSTREEGEVSIKSEANSKDKKKVDDLGEYVNFEEINENKNK